MPGHTGSHGGNKGFGGNKGKGGRRSSSAAQRGKKDNTPQGIGGMTPGPGPGGQMVGGAAPPSAGQAAAQGGTTAGFAGQGGFGGQGGGGLSLQQLFSPPPVMAPTPAPPPVITPPPEEGIATIPTNQELMQMMNQTPFGPPTAPNTPFSQVMDLPFGFIDYPGFINPVDEDNQPSYDSNQNVIDSFGSFPVGSGIMTIDPPGFSDLMKGKPSFGVDYSFPIDFLK